MASRGLSSSAAQGMFLYSIFIYSARKKIQSLPAFFSKSFFSPKVKQDKTTNQCFSRRRRSRTDSDQDVVVVVDEDAAAGDGDADDVLSAFFRPSSSSRFSPPRPGLPKQDFIRPPPHEKKSLPTKIFSCPLNKKHVHEALKIKIMLFTVKT